MSRQVVRDTTPEVRVRQALRSLGVGYRIHQVVVPGLRRTADIAFPGPRVAVFVDGCFWHGCPDHKGMPASNADWWADKIARNRARDLETDERLREAGWLPVRVWEHEDSFAAAKRITEIVRKRREDERKR